MGSVNWNLFHISGLCSNQREDKTTEEYFKEYEDEHIYITSKYTKEKVNGKTTNETKKVSIYNKDGYYDPKALLAPGNNYYLTNK